MVFICVIITLNNIPILFNFKDFKTQCLQGFRKSKKFKTSQISLKFYSFL